MAYEFIGPGKIVAGQDALASVPGEVRRLKGSRLLVVTDEALARTEPFGRLLSLLDGEKVAYSVFSGVEPDPGIEVVERGRQTCAIERPDVLLAFGGGSSIDTAKVVGALATNGGTVREYAGPVFFAKEPLPLIAAPTTAGTGSEVTPVAVITDEARKVKLVMRSGQMVPKSAVLDPALVGSLPPDSIAYTGMDALSHAMESFLSVRSSPITRQLSLAAVRLIYGSLIPFKADPGNTSLASGMLEGACLAGIAFGNSGLGAVHALAHPIGSHYHIAHGLACALFIRQVLSENRDAAPEAYRDLLTAMGIDARGSSAGECADRLVEAVSAFMKELGIPESLGAIGITHTVQPLMVEDALASPALMANPKKLDRERIIELLSSVE